MLSKYCTNSTILHNVVLYYIVYIALVVVKAIRLNARCSSVEYYKTHDRMDVQEIFRNQDDFTIADNKKVITTFSVRATEVSKYASTQSIKLKSL